MLKKEFMRTLQHALQFSHVLERLLSGAQGSYEYLARTSFQMSKDRLHTDLFQRAFNKDCRVKIVNKRTCNS